MLLLILALSFAGVSLSLGECTGDIGKILETCKTEHLKTVTEAAADQLASGSVDDLKNPQHILGLGNLGEICSNAAEVKAYYECVFSSFFDCLQMANSSLQDRIPDPENIGQGIQDLCARYKDVNMSCIGDVFIKGGSCVIEQEDSKSSDFCSPYETAEECFRESEVDCEGSDVVLDFLSSTKPASCEGTTQKLALSLLLLVAFAFFLKKDE